MARKAEVQLGQVWTAKVSNQIVKVRLDAVSRFGGWDAVNLKTGRSVRIKSAAKLRRLVPDTEHSGITFDDTDGYVTRERYI